MLLLELMKKFKHLLEKYIECKIRNGPTAAVPIYQNQSELAELVAANQLMVEAAKLMKRPNGKEVNNF
jgi:hypothetical protein